MKFGHCTKIDFDKIRAIAAAGFDYIELEFAELAQYESVPALKNVLREAQILCLSCNVFFVPTIKLVGRDRDVTGIEAYLSRMVPLAAELGVETLVFGNGRARCVPEGESPGEIYKHLRDIVERMETYAARNDLKIAVEPLNHTETDMILSYGEAVALTEGLTHVGAMVDSYHVLCNHQDYADVATNPQRLFHVHTAYSLERLAPTPADDPAEYVPLVQVLHQANYNGKISLEAREHGDYAQSLAAMRAIFAN
ncbi:MAG: sugar phosphate isomerase/epimerase [Defluviitaleaceae bacterium]|nr:sugar phosphate isomerase/epimerase [Defluviitaleaceae bacterium]